MQAEEQFGSLLPLKQNVRAILGAINSSQRIRVNVGKLARMQEGL